jgi:hypothetical protein
MIGYENLHKRKSSQNLNLDLNNQSLIHKYSTPVIKKEKASDMEQEMRRTYRIKPPLISSKFPSAFEFSKSDNKKSQLQPLMKINEIKNDHKDSSNSDSGKKRKNSDAKKSLNLEPIKLKVVKAKQIMKTKLSNDLKLLDKENEMEEYNKITAYENKRNNKFILKPIEIRDPRKVVNREIFEKSPQPAEIRYSFEKNFAKTSIVNFKLLENMDLQSLERNEKYSSEISKIEKNLNIHPGEYVKLYKNIKIENEEKTKMIKSHYENIVKEEMDTKESKFLKLDEMITLCNINSSRTCGNIKKMLHVPTFKIYTVRV